MTPTEQTELNKWIAEHVMGVTDETIKSWEGNWSPVTNSRQAFLVLEECALHHRFEINHHDNEFYFTALAPNRSKLGPAVIGSNFTETICLFARQLFQKP